MQLCPLKQIVFHNQENLFLSLTEWFRKIYIIFWFFFRECWWKCSHKKNPHFFLAYHQIFSFLSSTHTLSWNSSPPHEWINVIHKSTKYTWSLENFLTWSHFRWFCPNPLTINIGKITQQLMILGLVLAILAQATVNLQRAYFGNMAPWMWFIWVILALRAVFCPGRWADYYSSHSHSECPQCRSASVHRWFLHP